MSELQSAEIDLQHGAVPNFTITEMAWASDRHSLEQHLAENPSVASEIANTDATMSRILLTCYIAGAFIALQYLVCLTYIFLKL